jgi:hypothetical protein
MAMAYNPDSDPKLLKTPITPLGSASSGAAKVSILANFIYGFGFLTNKSILSTLNSCYPVELYTF